MLRKSLRKFFLSLERIQIDGHMKRKKLNRRDKGLLKKASRDDVIAAFSRVSKRLRHGRWLGRTNRYLQNTISRINVDYKANNFRHRQLAEYIASSTVLHCIDGWAFLSRALEAHRHGDRAAASHMSYYAELRAAMALLACEGIGIFNDKHVILEKSGRCSSIRGIGTHDIVWLTLEHWAGLRRSSRSLANIFKPFGLPLGRWLEGVQTRISWRPVGAMWLTSWGLDLKVFSQDKVMRNIASYRPTYLNRNGVLTTSETLAFMCNFWRLFEPVANTTFQTLDRFLLRRSLEESFFSVHGRRASATEVDFQQLVDSIINYLGFDAVYANEIKDFLLRSAAGEDPDLIKDAEARPLSGSTRQHLEMLSRATLLLRVATGSVAEVLRESGVAITALHFFMNVIGLEKGFWEETNVPADFLDLWADVEFSIDKVETWLSAAAQNNRVNNAECFRDNDLISALVVLGQCERVGLWGIT